MKNFFLTILVSFQFTVFPQNYKLEFGQITNEEIQMEYYPKDKDVGAVVICDLGKSYFVGNADGGYNVVFEKRSKIKIFNKAGLPWAEVEIPFYREGNIYEIIYDLEAITWNFDNGILSKALLDVKNTYDEKLNEYWMVKKFALPNVKEGSVIEYRYKLETPYKFNFRDWEFQLGIPVMYSEYIVS